MPPGRPLGIPVLLALLVVLPILAPPTSANVRQSSFEDAEEDASIFFAILTRAVDRSERQIQLAAEQGSGSPVVEANRSALRNQLANFDERLVSTIESQGTPPAELAELVSDYEALAEGIRRVLASQSGLAESLDDLPEGALVESDDVTPRVSARPLENALAALERERAGLTALEQASRELDEYGVEPDQLASAIDAREQRLETVEGQLVRELARLDLPRFLTIDVERSQVQLGQTLGVNGLALSGGEPARDATVNLTLGTKTARASVGEDGRVQAQVPVPFSLGTGTVELSAESYINGSTVETAPVPVEVRPLEPSLSIAPATTVLDDRSPLRVDGRLSTGPLGEEGRNVTLFLGGDPAANATAGPDGRFSALVPTTNAEGGQTSLQARLTPSDDRLASVRSAAVQIFIPGERANEPGVAGGPDDENFIGLGGGQAVFNTFDFPSSGLGPAVDLLAGLTGLGLLVLVAHAMLAGREGVGVERLKRFTTFGTWTQFEPASRETVLEAHPLNAFPPGELDSARRGEELVPGVLFAAFVSGLREFEEDLPPGLTHRELARKLYAETDLDRGQLVRAANLFEQAQYAQAPLDGDSESASGSVDPSTRRELLDAFTVVWEAYVTENVADPEDTSSWLPKAPTWVPFKD